MRLTVKLIVVVASALDLVRTTLKIEDLKPAASPSPKSVKQ